MQRIHANGKSSQDLLIPLGAPSLVSYIVEERAHAASAAQGQDTLPFAIRLGGAGP